VPGESCIRIPPSPAAAPVAVVAAKEAARAWREYQWVSPRYFSHPANPRSGVEFLSYANDSGHTPRPSELHRLGES